MSELSTPASRRPAGVRRARHLPLLGAVIFVLVPVACGSTDHRDLQGQPDGENTDSAASGGTKNSGGKGGHGGTGTGGANSGSGAAAGAAGYDAVCGDGVLDPGELCDDGNTDSGDGCDASCKTEVTKDACGDGIVGSGEECDDGNAQSGDGCSDTCKKEACGNGRVDAGEECDPPSAGTCTSHCIRVTADCGDGKVQTDEGEQCDDGNDKAGDGCVDCRKECGDGKIDASLGEQCEPDYSTHCSTSCRWLPTCGDGTVQPDAGEQCDPSNGTTCVDCRFHHPGDCGSAGQGGGGGEGGCSGTNDCVPQGATDLVENGNFAVDISGWSSPASAVHLGLVFEGSPDADALEVRFDTGSVRAVSGAYQCIPIEGKRQYALTARYRIPPDAPYDVAATITAAVYSGTDCNESPVGTVMSGPQGQVRDQWTPYAMTVDTSALPSGTEGRLFLRLNVVRPGNADGSRVLWDTVSIPDVGGTCGNCVVDPGETCDDGNRKSGDGCDRSCKLEGCGDGVVGQGEQCDDGNTVFATGDDCTPACRTPDACDTCAAGACASQVAGCLGLTGVMPTGPRAYVAQSTLCDDLRECVRRTSCDLASRTTLGATGTYLENCYCGTSGDHCFDADAPANGSCRHEVEAALGTTNPQEMLGRFGGTDSDYPVFGALKTELACETTSCADTCGRTPKCGDGLIEDRNLDYTFIVNHIDTPCRDDLTASGHGCTVEECDDGANDGTPGDKCDQYCFRVVCGNNVKQDGEECDDGNQVSNDGCSADCKAEYTCGDGVVTHPFEQCDPPSSSAEGSSCTANQAQAPNAKDTCACDSQCQYVVCGDGIVRHPWEDCDPPDGQTCDTDCKFLPQTPCEQCIGQDPANSEFYADYCGNDPACIAVERCVVQSGCLQEDGTNLACFCGGAALTCTVTDGGCTGPVQACRNDSYQPTGPCADVMRAGINQGNATNADVQDFLFDYTQSTGAAFLVLDAEFEPDLGGACREVCFPYLSGQ